MSPCVRATRSVRKPSLGARSRETHPDHPRDNLHGEAWKGHLGSLAAPCLRQGASLGEEADLAGSGRAREVDARVGRVRDRSF